MAINLELNQLQFEKSESESTTVHYIPASINGDGPAEVSTYFNHYTTNENGVLNNSFRGYPLQGCKFEIPKSYKGLIFQEADTPLDENSNRVFKFAGSFKDMNYWNYDKIPTKADAFRQMWDVLSVAEAMSSDIPLSEINKRVEESREKKSTKDSGEADS